MMHWENCFMRVKVVRLLIIFGAFSSVAVFLIYSLPSNDKSLTTSFNHGLFSTWPIKSSSNLLHLNAKTSEILADFSENHNINILLRNHQNRHDKSKTNKNHGLRNKIKRLTSNRLQNDDTMIWVNATKKLPKHSAPNIHIFYTLPVDWSQQTTAFYPLLGFYAPDNKTLRHHFKNIELLGANVLIVTWSSTSQEQLIWHLFDEAPHFGLRIAIEIDNYPNRSVVSIFNDIQYFYKEFWQHPSLYKVFVSSKSNYMPMFYIKNVDNLAANDWKKLLTPKGEISLRSTLHDAVFVGHIRYGSFSVISIK